MVVELANSDIGFYYRGNSLENIIFLEAKFRYEKGQQQQIKALMEDINLKRKTTQPINEKTCGSTFANPIGHKAWELIERVGMRGSTLNNAQISNLHCNFLINNDGAKAQDLEDLATLAQTKVLEQCGVELKWEVKRLGKKDI
jgi:UDP-N-acetylmuramate dehydrogenase